jgi:ribosome biogenesis GTPase
MPVSGRIIEEQKSYFIVNTEHGNVRCTIRGTLKKNKTKLCAGDLVELDLINKTPPEGVITTLHSRIGLLKRPAVANLSQVFIITTIKTPSLDLESLDRFLFSAHVYNIEPVIVFNKIDLLESQELNYLKEIEDIYNRIGYQIIETSVPTSLGVNEILRHCQNKISAFAGLSGVGKSSLLSLLFPDKKLRIGDVSGTKGRGTHTTTNVSLFPLKQGAILPIPPDFHL